MRKQILFVMIPVLLVLTVLVGSDHSFAQGPAGVRPLASLGQGFTYQGRLKDGGGNPIDSTCDFTFSLWDDLGAGTQVGGDCNVAGVQVANGYFAAQVDAGGEFGGSAFTGDARWLQISVQCSGDAGYTTLSPRQELAAAPYALSLRPGANVVGSVSGGAVISGQNNSITGRGVSGSAYAASGTTFGVYGLSVSTDGRGVYGLDNAASGTTYGVYGQSLSPNGYGVYGSNPSGTAVYGAGPNAVVGDSSSPNYGAIVGRNYASSGTGYGVYGLSASTDNGAAGVYGYASATSGSTYGVYGSSVSGAGVWGTGLNGVVGISSSPGYAAVHGQNDATSGKSYGVYGQSSSNDGYGVFGRGSVGVRGETSVEGAGVMGVAMLTTGYGIGVYGIAESGYGWAGMFEGSVQVNGMLYKSGGGFKIDDPLDPANQYLYHSFVESPDMKNIYDGVVVLDQDGMAWVQMPAWFQAVNQDYRYQLTPIGAPAPSLYIAQKIQGNRFQIAGGTPGLEVSWQVTGIRHDPYAEAHRIPVEQVKPAGEQGTYLHPELYGQPESKRLDYQYLHGLSSAPQSAQPPAPAAKPE